MFLYRTIRTEHRTTEGSPHPLPQLRATDQNQGRGQQHEALPQPVLDQQVVELLQLQPLGEQQVGVVGGQVQEGEQGKEEAGAAGGRMSPAPGAGEGEEQEQEGEQGSQQGGQEHGQPEGGGV